MTKQEWHNDLEIIKNIVDENRGLDSLVQEEKVYPVIRELSKLRENVLAWYEFEENADILEIGAGCGAITGLLCEKAKSVTAVEFSEEKSGINRKRHAAYKNLKVISGDLNRIGSARQYDYIVLNESLGYADIYLGKKDSYVEFLNRVSEMLKNGGCILLLSNNRLGTRYFSGAPEEHTEGYFNGIDGNFRDGEGRSFTKRELEALCNKAGLDCARFYYPYPGYEFANEIFTDDTVNLDGYGKPYAQFSEKRLCMFNEQKLVEELRLSGLADRFANSFLVEIVKSNAASGESKAKKIEYVKVNADRDEKFQSYTLIYKDEDGRKVAKGAINGKSREHLKKMQEYGSSCEGSRWSPLRPEYDDEKGILTYPWITGESYDKRLENLILNRDTDGMASLISEIKDIFFENTFEANPYKHDGFVRVFGNGKNIENTNFEKEYLCVNNPNIDIILSNIFVGDEKRRVIDYEWTFDFPVPADYIVWRIVDAMYHDHPGLDCLVARDDFESKIGLEKDDKTIFRAWEDSFVYGYVGVGRLAEYENGAIPVDLKGFADRHLKEGNIETQLFLDFGTGFSEENSITRVVFAKNGRFCVKYEFPEKIILSNIRFDPAQVPCCLENVEIKVDGISLPLEPVGACVSGGKDVFLHIDPGYMAVVREGDSFNAGVVEISGCIELLSETEIYDYQILFQNDRNALEEKCVAFENDVAAKETHIENLGLRIKGLEKAVSDKDVHIGNLGSRIEDLEKAVSDKDVHIGNLGNRIGDLEKAVSDKDVHIGNLDNMISDLNGQIDERNARIKEINDDKECIYNELVLIKQSRMYNLYVLWNKIKGKIRGIKSKNGVD